MILACRNEKKAKQAQKKIISETGNLAVAVEQIDMTSFASVQTFAKHILESEERIDILVNNVGILLDEHILTSDGNILLMQVNYFSSFLLTNLLLGNTLTWCYKKLR